MTAEKFLAHLRQSVLNGVTQPTVKSLVMTTAFHVFRLQDPETAKSHWRMYAENALRELMAVGVVLELTDEDILLAFYTTEHQYPTAEEAGFQFCNSLLNTVSVPSQATVLQEYITAHAALKSLIQIRNVDIRQALGLFVGMGGFR